MHKVVGWSKFVATNWFGPQKDDRCDLLFPASPQVNLDLSDLYLNNFVSVSSQHKQWIRSSTGT